MSAFLKQSIALECTLTLMHNSVVVWKEFFPCCNVSKWYEDNTTKRPPCVRAVVDIGQILSELHGKLVWHIILLVTHVSRPLVGAVVHILTHSKWVLWSGCQPAGVTHHEGPYSVPATARLEHHFGDAFVVSINQNTIDAPEYKGVSDGLEKNRLIGLIYCARVHGNCSSFGYKSFGDKHSSSCKGQSARLPVNAESQTT